MRSSGHIAGRHVASVLGALLLVAATLGVGGCAKSEKPPVDPAQVFSESVTAMQAVKSFHFTYEVTKPEGAAPAQGSEIVRIVGDVTAEGRMRAVIDVETNGVPLQLQFVAAGQTHYVQDPTSQKWQSLPAQFSPVGKINLNTGTIQILQRIAKPEYVAEESVGDVSTYHLKGSVAATDVAAIAGATSTTEPFAGDVWIGVNDHLVRRIQLVGAATSSENPATLRTIELSKFNEDVTIEPPQ
ncbi:MAG: hypothetical protein Kow00122_07150 [Thermoleophilia bacterium]